jgi:hypothetical protein
LASARYALAAALLAEPEPIEAAPEGEEPDDEEPDDEEPDDEPEDELDEESDDDVDEPAADSFELVLLELDSLVDDPFVPADDLSLPERLSLR